MDNGIYKVTSNLLKLSGIKFTKYHLKKSLSLHPSFPSIESIVDVLEDEYQIKSLPASLNTQQLPDIPYPAIIQTTNTNKGSQLSILQKYESEGKMLKLYGKDGTSRIPISEFDKIWTGITLLFSFKKAEIEHNYNRNRKKEITKYFITALIGLLILAVFIPLTYDLIKSNFFIPLSILLCTKTIGMVMSIFLMFNHYSDSLAINPNLCKTNKLFDCGALAAINAKIFGVHLSEYAAFYFTSGILSIIFFYTANKATLLIFFAFTSFFALPFLAYSIYYQGFVVKKWCLFCLALILIVVIELYTSHGFLTFQFFKQIVSIKIFYSILLASAILISLSNHLQLSNKYSLLFNSLNKYKYNIDIISLLINNQKTVNLPGVEKILLAGEEKSNTSITLVTNPSCKHCKTIFNEIIRLHHNYPDKLNVNVIFFVNINNKSSVGYIVANRLIEVHNLLEALTDWYENNYKKSYLNEWLSKYPSQAKRPVGLLENHYNWSVENQIKYTPSTIINGKIIPPYIEWEMVKYYLKTIFN